MKIISEGNIPTPSKKWWAGQKICCGFCTVEFILEEDDDVMEVVEKNLNGGILARFNCPICTQILTCEKLISRKENLWKTTVMQKDLIDQIKNSNIPQFIDHSSKNIAGDSERHQEILPHARLNVPVLESNIVQAVTEKRLAAPLQKSERYKKSFIFWFLPWKWFVILIFINI